MVVPPKPDRGSALVGGSVALLYYLYSGDASSSLVLGLLAGVLSLPLMFMLREFAVFRASRVLSPEEAGLVAEWIREAGVAVGVRSSVTVLYTFRRGLGLQVMQLGGPLGREEAQIGLLQLLHRAAWSAMPAATRTRKGSILVAVPARVMETLHGLAARSRNGVYLRLARPSHIRLAYGVVREIARASNAGAGRVYTAYLATKALASMLLRGWIRLDEGLEEHLDRLVPAEPWWVRRRVLRQLEEERLLATPS